MLLNDFEKDVKHLLVDEELKKKDLSDRMGVSPQRISQILETAGVTGSFVRLVQALGYDIKVEYVKRDCGEDK